MIENKFINKLNNVERKNILKIILIKNVNKQKKICCDEIKAD